MKVYAGGMEQAQIQMAIEKPDFWHEMIDMIGDKFGYEWLLLLSAFGALFFFRKHIGRFFQT